MGFYADFHIHSRFSRATSKELTIPNLAKVAARKGLALIGTGDITHEKWLDELEDALTPIGNGLFATKDSETQFILTGEISHIYKEGNRTRKVHNIVVCPDFDSTKKLRKKLLSFGFNLASDGRPIMKLRCRDLLEILLEISERNILIPAHIWTPWFSLFGSKSGYDTIEECYGDLSKHIFAMETGLSSDIPMNRSIKMLDNISMISNSDAHSLSKLGRNATYFDCDLDFDQIKRSLEKGSISTVDMYPQEGKYHFDGHRKCDIVFHPKESQEHGNICPVCKKPLTLGVLHRVYDLADCEIPESSKNGYQYIVPLAELLSEVMQVGAGSKKVNRVHTLILDNIATELQFLLEKNLDEVQEQLQFCEPEISIKIVTALRNMRLGKINVSPGYDGVFGKISLLPKNR